MDKYLGSDIIVLLHRCSSVSILVQRIVSVFPKSIRGMSFVAHSEISIPRAIILFPSTSQLALRIDQEIARRDYALALFDALGHLNIVLAPESQSYLAHLVYTRFFLDINDLAETGE